MANEKQVEVRMVRSAIGCTERQRATLRSLGLGKISSSRVHTLTPQVKGLIGKVAHLVEVKDVK